MRVGLKLVLRIGTRLLSFRMGREDLGEESGGCSIVNIDYEPGSYCKGVFPPFQMCGRSIAPLKLMHRIKHMKSEFEEKGRIQLYEFFNLIVW